MSTHIQAAVRYLDFEVQAKIQWSCGVLFSQSLNIKLRVIDSERRVPSR